MKKIMSIGLVFCLILSLLLAGLPQKAMALNEMQITTGGSTSKVTYSQVNNNEEIRIFASSIKVIKEFVIAPEGSITNYRLGIEISGTSVDKSIKFDVNKGSVVQIRLGNLSNSLGTSVVVETTKKPDYTLAPSSDGKSLVLTLKGTVSTPSGTPAPAPSSTPKASASPSPTPKPTITPAPATSTVPAASTPTNSPKPSLKTSNGPLSLSISGDTCSVKFNGISLSQSTIGSTPRYELREKEKIIQITIPGKDAFVDGFLPGNSVIYGVLVNYSIKQNHTVIRVCYTNPIAVSHIIANGSSTLNIKPGSATVPASSPVPPSSTPVASIPPKPSATPTPSATPAPATPKPSADAGASYYRPAADATLTNIAAGNGDGVVVLRFVNPGIVSRYRQYMSDITIDDSSQNGTVTMVIPKAIVDLGNGTAYIEDGLVQSVVAFGTATNNYFMINKANPDKSFKIAEYGADELQIVVNTGSNTGTIGSKLVVLDPGHGGTDPGGVAGTYLEKNYNLAIALKCEAILKSKGMNVALTRTTDVFIPLDDRAKFANDRNASLFISIHNNIMPAGTKGSMALYYPTSYNGKAYAQIIQNNLVRDLKTENIGLKAVGDLVVLRKTKMPAVLAEVACMSDPGDMSLLNTEAFIQKAAESLANSIVQIMSTR